MTESNPLSNSHTFETVPVRSSNSAMAETVKTRAKVWSAVSSTITRLFFMSNDIPGHILAVLCSYKMIQSCSLNSGAGSQHPTWSSVVAVR